MSPFSLDPDLISWSYLLQFLVFVPLGIFALRQPGQHWHEAIGLKRVPLKVIVQWTVLWLLGWLLAAFLYWQLPVPADPFVQAVNGTKHLGLSLSSVMLAPLLEEIIFRGCAFQLLRPRWPGQYGTLFITSLLFMLIHLGQYSFMLLTLMFLLGVLLGLAREKTGSLLVPLALHTLNNLLFVILIIWLGLA